MKGGSPRTAAFCCAPVSATGSAPIIRYVYAGFRMVRQVDMNEFACEVRCGTFQTRKKNCPRNISTTNWAARCSTPSRSLPEYGLTRADRADSRSLHAAEIPRDFAWSRSSAAVPAARPGRFSRRSGPGLYSLIITQSMFRAPRSRGAAGSSPAWPTSSPRGVVPRRPRSGAITDAMEAPAAGAAFSAAPSATSTPVAEPIFLRQVRSRTAAGRRDADRLRFGEADSKPCLTPMTILPASPASFNLNLLGRINRELGGDFDMRAFAHQARYNETSAASKCTCARVIRRWPSRKPISTAASGPARPSGRSRRTSSRRRKSRDRARDGLPAGRPMDR